MGALTGSICQRRGRIESDGRAGRAQGHPRLCPALPRCSATANTIRTLSQGRALFTMHFEHYEAVPFSLAEEIIRKRREANLIR